MYFSFAKFFNFLTMFQLIQYVFLIYEVFPVSRHIGICLTMCVSNFARFSMFIGIFQVLHCVSHFPNFQFSHHIPGHTVCISHFPHFSVFLAIFQDLQSFCFIFHVFQSSHHNPGPRVCISHFSVFSLFLGIFQVLQCVCCHFPHLSVFSPYPRSYRVCFSFCTCFSVSRHIPVPTM